MSSNVEEKTREKITFSKLFWIFVIGSIFGAFYEEILTCIKTLIQTGQFEWVLRRGVIYGPFSPIYGAGAVLMTILLVRYKNNWMQTYCYGAILGGSFEYLISILQEIFIGTCSWNYSKQFLNIHGRTTIPIMMVWGLFVLLFVYVIYPWISKFLDAVPKQFYELMTKVCVVLMAFDLLISWTALFRQTLRRNNVPPLTPVGRLYDKVYSDEFLSKYFTNMVPTKKIKRHLKHK